MSQKDELIQRMKAKKAQMSADLENLKLKAHENKNEKEKELESKIEELSGDIKELSNNFSESVAERVNKWLQ